MVEAQANPLAAAKAANGAAPVAAAAAKPRQVSTMPDDVRAISAIQRILGKLPAATAASVAQYALNAAHARLSQQ